MMRLSMDKEGEDEELGQAQAVEKTSTKTV